MSLVALPVAGGSSKELRMARPVLRPLSLVAAIAVTLALLPVGTSGAGQQIFSATTGRVQNVSFQQLGAGVIEIRYDLVAESPAARFTIDVRVSQDGGRSFSVLAKSVSGDITNVAPGSNRRIVWQSGSDLEALFIDQLRFEVLATAGPGRAVATLNVRSALPGPRPSPCGTSRRVDMSFV
jgi:hypothetical protein